MSRTKWNFTHVALVGTQRNIIVSIRSQNASTQHLLGIWCNCTFMYMYVTHKRSINLPVLIWWYDCRTPTHPVLFLLSVCPKAVYLYNTGGTVYICYWVCSGQERVSNIHSQQIRGRRPLKIIIIHCHIKPTTDHTSINIDRASMISCQEIRGMVSDHPISIGETPIKNTQSTTIANHHRPHAY